MLVRRIKDCILKTKLRGLQGIKVFLDRNGYTGNLNNERELNEFFRLFFDEMGWLDDYKLRKNNRRYNPTIDNGYIIQCNFKEFRDWYLKRRYEKGID